jgi:hypothetical protein
MIQFLQQRMATLLFILSRAIFPSESHTRPMNLREICEDKTAVWASRHKALDAREGSRLFEIAADSSRNQW